MRKGDILLFQKAECPLFECLIAIIGGAMVAHLFRDGWTAAIRRMHACPPNDPITAASHSAGGNPAKSRVKKLVRNSKDKIERKIKIGGAMICLAPLVMPILAIAGFIVRVFFESLSNENTFEFIGHALIFAIFPALLGLFMGFPLVLAMNLIDAKKHVAVAFSFYVVAILTGLFIVDCWGGFILTIAGFA